MQKPQTGQMKTFQARYPWEISVDSPGTKALNVYLHHLRNKIDKGFETKLIHTIRDMDYALKE